MAFFTVPVKSPSSCSVFIHEIHMLSLSAMEVRLLMARRNCVLIYSGEEVGRREEI